MICENQSWNAACGVNSCQRTERMEYYAEQKVSIILLSRRLPRVRTFCVAVLVTSNNKLFNI